MGYAMQMQLSGLTGPPNLGAGNNGIFNTGIGNTAAATRTGLPPHKAARTRGVTPPAMGVA